MPDIIILDMKLNDIEGYGNIVRLRSSKDISAVPILAMSRYVEELQKLKEDSALALIGKPFKLEDLIAKIRTLLKQEA